MADPTPMAGFTSIMYCWRDRFFDPKKQNQNRFFTHLAIDSILPILIFFNFEVHCAGING